MHLKHREGKDTPLKKCNPTQTGRVSAMHVGDKGTNEETSNLYQNMTNISLLMIIKAVKGYRVWFITTWVLFLHFIIKDWQKELAPHLS